ncbi:MAG: hypothetical protein PHQ43_08370, partial [Dehalococcoidales bacterium]|nr:hypothetical protein [Dehalococcoidales bacterium]
GNAGADTLTVTGTLTADNASMTLKKLTVTEDAAFATTSGNVGIGTASPGAKLVVGTGDADVQIKLADSRGLFGYQPSGNYVQVGGGAGKNLQLFADNAAKVTVKTDGNVGIGVASPTATLHVNGPTRIGPFSYASIGSPNTGHAIIGRETSGGRATGGLTVWLGGSSATNTSFEIVDRDWTKVISSISGEAPSGSFTVDSTGQVLMRGANVGIGITSPVFKLHAAGTIKSALTESNKTGITLGNEASERPKVEFNVSDNSRRFWMSVANVNEATERLQIFAGPLNNSATTEAVSIGGTSNVGIGTTAPTAKLDIQGTAGGTGDKIRFTSESGYYNAIGNYNSNEMYIQPHTYTRILKGYAYTSGGRKMTAADTMFRIDTANVLLAENGGKVGIGTAAPAAGLAIGAGTANYATTANDLYVTGNIEVDGNTYLGDATSDTLTVMGTLTATNASMTLKKLTVTQDTYLATSSGNVGINTDSPQKKLHILAGSGADGEGIVLAEDGTSSFMLETNYSPSGNDNKLHIATTGYGRSGTWSDPEEIVTFTVGGNVGIGTASPATVLDVNGSIGIGGQTVLGADASSIVVGDLIGGDGQRALRLRAGDDDKVYINTAGNFGIGTTNPGARLDVRVDSTGDVLSRIWNSNTSGTGTATLRIANSGNQAKGATLQFTDNNYYVGTIAADRTNGLIFRTGINQNPETSLSDRVTILPGGNVGIGTTSPAFILDVAGSPRFGSPSGASNIEIADVDGANYRIATGGYDLSFQKKDSDAGTFVTVMQIAGANANDGAPNVYIVNSVGIGTASPGAGLAVGSGTIDHAGQSNGLYVGGNLEVDGSAWLGDNASVDSLYVAGTLSAANSSMTLKKLTVSEDAVFATTSGNVGIGTANPQSKLHLSSLGSKVGLRLDNGNNYEILLNNGGNIAASGGDMILLAESGYKLRFGSNGTNSQMTLNAGNLGIGTTSPSEKLVIQDASAGLRAEIINTQTSGWTQLNFNQQSGATGGAYISRYGSAHSEARNMRIWNRDSATIDFGTNNEQKLRIASNGNVGIGTVSPGATLDVNGSTYFRNWASWNGQGTITWDGAKPGTFNLLGASGKGISLGTNGVYDRFYIDTNGNVGIGTTNPNLAALDISRTQSGSISSFLQLSTNSTTAESGAAIDIRTTTGTTVNRHVARIAGIRSTAGSGASELAFYTESGSALNEAMRILYNGSIGIGTTNPLNKLQVGGISGEAGAGAQMIRVVSTDNNAASLKLVETTTTNEYGFQWKNDGNNNRLDLLYGSNTLANGNNDLPDAGLTVLRSNGYVGIGTTSPAVKLDIAGDVNLNNQALTGAGSVNRGYYVYKSGTTAYGMKLQYTGTEYGTLIFGPNQSNRFIGFGKIGTALEDDDVVEYARIDLDNGRFGIGTAAPAETLDVNGTTRLSGNVGIGTTAPLSTYKLYVNGNAYLGGLTVANGTLSFGGDLNMNNSLITNIGASATDFTSGGGLNLAGNLAVDTNVLYVDTSANNVGIGTASPGAKLQVFGGNILLDNAANIQFKNTGGSAVNILRYNSSDYTILGGNSEIEVAGGGKLWMGGGASTYLWSTGAIPLRLGANSTEYMRITSNGNVGIGTASPTSGYRLDVYGATIQRGTLDMNTNAIQTIAGSGTLTGDTNHFVVRSGTNALDFEVAASGTSKMRIDNTGSVGIGTTSPLQSIGGGGSYSGWLGTHIKKDSYGIMLIEAGSRARLQLTDSNAATDQKNFAIDAIEGVLQFNTVNDALTGTTSRMVISSDGKVGIGTADPGTAGFTVMNGYVGIGTTAPASRLDVQGSGGSTQVIRMLNTTGVVRGAMYLTSAQAGQFYLYDDNGNTDVKLSTIDNSYFNGGNVGVGTTDPKETLDVSGTARITGNLGIGTTAPLSTYKLYVNGNAYLGGLT